MIVTISRGVAAAASVRCCLWPVSSVSSPVSRSGRCSLLLPTVPEVSEASRVHLLLHVLVHLLVHHLVHEHLYNHLASQPVRPLFQGSWCLATVSNSKDTRVQPKLQLAVVTRLHSIQLSVNENSSAHHQLTIPEEESLFLSTENKMESTYDK